MIKSMTGFGQSMMDDGQAQISIELRTLNSKFLDIGLRIPKLFADKELEIRNIISERLERGKISLSIEYQRHGDSETKQTYNEALFIAYYNELKRMADKVYAPHDGLFAHAITAPDVVQNKIKEEASDEEWKKVKEALLEVIKKCESFRVAEGKVLENMLRECCHSIREGLTQVERLDSTRIERIRDKLKGSVVSFFGEEGYDVNRLEQEIIFYIEKLDINEEKVRLKSHLDYFMAVLNEPQANGKKLGFISQEIGREINTIGSKANDAEIQKHVILMKEELEKIKEQLGNVL